MHRHPSMAEPRNFLQKAQIIPKRRIRVCYDHSRGAWLLPPCGVLYRSVLQVLQGEKPFSQYRLPGQVVAAVLLRKERPAFDPSALGPGARYVWAWKVAEKCWNTNPQDRPTAHQAACYLHPDYQDVRIGLKLRRYAIGVMVLALTISAFFFALTKLFVVPIPTSPLCFSDTVSVPMIIHYTFSPDLDDLCRP